MRSLHVGRMTLAYNLMILKFYLLLHNTRHSFSTLTGRLAVVDRTWSSNVHDSISGQNQFCGESANIQISDVYPEISYIGYALMQTRLFWN